MIVSQLPDELDGFLKNKTEKTNYFLIKIIHIRTGIKRGTKGFNDALLGKCDIRIAANYKMNCVCFSRSNKIQNDDTAMTLHK